MAGCPQTEESEGLWKLSKLRKGNKLNPFKRDSLGHPSSEKEGLKGGNK
jgi:hypothetical protein